MGIYSTNKQIVSFIKQPNTMDIFASEGATINPKALEDTLKQQRVGNVKWEYSKENALWSLYIDNVYCGVFDNYEKQKQEKIIRELYILWVV